jgi:hypothetical protein
MWSHLKKFLARSKTLSSSFGEVIFETETIQGQSSYSLFQWRIKKGLDEKSIFVALKLLPDAYMGPEGRPINYISFDIASAELARAELDRCIAEYYRLTDAAGAT